MKDTIKGIKKYLIRKCEAIIPDKLYLQIKYYKRFHKFCDFKNPVTYNEKLQWLKLYDRRPEYTNMVDKYEVKKIVADKIGQEYVIPTLGVWNKFDEIDFEQLPKQFVIKCTHDSGGVVIVKDKDKFDRKKAKKKINFSLKCNYYWHGREWAYKNVRPRILAEKYIANQGGGLDEYKFFCFNGEPKIVLVVKDRYKTGKPNNDFFDMNFKKLPFSNGYPNSHQPIKCPESFDKMKELAKVLSEGIPQIRVDFYNLNNQIYFGELTFAHWGGMKPFDPPEWDSKLGKWIKLPERKV